MIRHTKLVATIVERNGAWLPFVGETVIPAAFIAVFREGSVEISVKVIVRFGRPVVAELNVEAMARDSAVTGALLASIRVPSLLRAALEAATEPNGGRAVTHVDQIPEGEGRWVSSPVGRRSDRPPGSAQRFRRTKAERDQDLRVFAEAYNEAKRSGGALNIKTHACRQAGIASGSYGRYRTDAIAAGFIIAEESK